MSDNLYAPPQADLGGGPELAIGTGDFELGRCLSEAWARTWSNFPLWLGAGIVGLLASAASAVTIIGIPFLLPVIYWGGFVFFLRMHDGRASVGDLFAGFSQYGRALVGMLGFFLLNIAASIPGTLVSQIGTSSTPPDMTWVALGNLIALLVAFFVTSRLTFAPFLMIDRGIGLGEALSLAWSQTTPLAWKIVGLMLLMVAVLIGGVVAFIVGVIPASVMGYLMWVSAYRQIFGGGPKAAA
jgi:hypothetical protein